MEEIVSLKVWVMLKDSLISIRQRDWLVEVTEFKSTKIQQMQLQV